MRSGHTVARTAAVADAAQSVESPESAGERAAVSDRQSVGPSELFYALLG